MVCTRHGPTNKFSFIHHVILLFVYMCLIRELERKVEHNIDIAFHALF